MSYQEAISILYSTDCQPYVQETYAAFRDVVLVKQNELPDGQVLESSICETSRRSEASEREKGYESRLPNTVSNEKKCAKAGNDVIAMNFRNPNFPNLGAALKDSDACKAEVRQEIDNWINLLKDSPKPSDVFNPKFSFVLNAFSESLALDGGAVSTIA